MQWVPPSVINRLDRGVMMLRARGLVASRKDVVGLLALHCAPATAAARGEVVAAYQRKNAPSRSGRRERKALMVHLPSPISLRIDAMVEEIRDTGLVAYRHDVVGALALECFPKSERLPELFQTYRAAKAGDSPFAGVPARRLLSSTPPRQGPRPRH